MKWNVLYWAVMAGMWIGGFLIGHGVTYKECPKCYWEKPPCEEAPMGEVVVIADERGVILTDGSSLGKVRQHRFYCPGSPHIPDEPTVHIIQGDSDGL